MNMDLNEYPKELYSAGGILKKYLLDNLDKDLEKITVCDKNLENLIKNILKSENKDIQVCIQPEYLKKFDKDTQFIVITHRKGTMEAADTVYGITMEEKGISKLLSLNMNQNS